MSNVIYSMSMSLDGFIAGPGVGADLPLGSGVEALHHWASGEDEQGSSLS